MAEAKQGPPASGARRERRVRLYVYGVASVFTIALATSLFLRLSSIDRTFFDLAREMGRSFFDEIVTNRHWISHQGGVYVPETAAIQPNSYLDESMRSL